MNITNGICGTNKLGRFVHVKTGDRVRAVALDGNEFTDVVRGGFMQHNTLGHTFPAVILTVRSWVALSDLLPNEETT